MSIGLAASLAIRAKRGNEGPYLIIVGDVSQHAPNVLDGHEKFFRIVRGRKDYSRRHKVLDILKNGNVTYARRKVL